MEGRSRNGVGDKGLLRYMRSRVVAAGGEKRQYGFICGDGKDDFSIESWLVTTRDWSTATTTAT